MNGKKESKTHRELIILSIPERFLIFEADMIHLRFNNLKL